MPRTSPSRILVLGSTFIVIAAIAATASWCKEFDFSLFTANQRVGESKDTAGEYVLEGLSRSDSADIGAVRGSSTGTESYRLFTTLTVFSDDFSTNTSATFTTSGAMGSSAWSVLVPNADFGARRNTSAAQLELTNDAGAAANANGWCFASTATSSFSFPYNTTLNSNPGLVTWTFNMRQIRTDPAGLASGSYGVAFILTIIRAADTWLFWDNPAVLIPFGWQSTMRGCMVR